MTVESAETEGALLSPGSAPGELELASPASFVVNRTSRNAIVPTFAEVARRGASVGSHFHSWCEGLLEAFGLVGSGAILFGPGGQVISANAAAGQLFGSGINLVNGQLVAFDRASNVALQEMLQALRSQGTPRVGQRIAIARRGEPPLLAHAIPLDRLNLDGSTAAGLVVLVDPQTRREPSEPLLQQVFNLTPAEARLALGLAKGLDLQEISELHGVGVGTLRVQLKSVFAKTHTKRQAQLVVLLAKLVL